LIGWCLTSKDVITLVKTAEESEVRHSTKTNTKTIVQLRANTEITRNCFSIRVAKVWNRLPEKIVMAPSINSFKNRLDKGTTIYLEGGSGWLWFIFKKRDRPFNLKRGVMVFCFVQKKNFGQHTS
jgi:hypothetical protein